MISLSFAKGIQAFIPPIIPGITIAPPAFAFETAPPTFLTSTHSTEAAQVSSYVFKPKAYGYEILLGDASRATSSLWRAALRSRDVKQAEVEQSRSNDSDRIYGSYTTSGFFAPKSFKFEGHRCDYREFYRIYVDNRHCDGDFFLIFQNLTREDRLRFAIRLASYIPVNVDLTRIFSEIVFPHVDRTDIPKLAYAIFRQCNICKKDDDIWYYNRPQLSLFSSIIPWFARPDLINYARAIASKAADTHTGISYNASRIFKEVLQALGEEGRDELVRQIEATDERDHPLSGIIASLGYVIPLLDKSKRLARVIRMERDLDLATERDYSDDYVVTLARRIAGAVQYLDESDRPDRAIKIMGLLDKVDPWFYSNDLVKALAYMAPHLDENTRLQIFRKIREVPMLIRDTEGILSRNAIKALTGIRNISPLVQQRFPVTEPIKLHSAHFNSLLCGGAWDDVERALSEAHEHYPVEKKISIATHLMDHMDVHGVTAMPDHVLDTGTTFLSSSALQIFEDYLRQYAELMREMNWLNEKEQHERIAYEVTATLTYPDVPVEFAQTLNKFLGKRYDNRIPAFVVAAGYALLDDTSSKLARRYSKLTGRRYIYDGGLWGEDAEDKSWVWDEKIDGLKRNGPKENFSRILGSRTGDPFPIRVQKAVDKMSARLNELRNLSKDIELRKAQHDGPLTPLIAAYYESDNPSFMSHKMVLLAIGEGEQTDQDAELCGILMHENTLGSWRWEMVKRLLERDTTGSIAKAVFDHLHSEEAGGAYRRRVSVPQDVIELARAVNRVKSTVD